MHAERGIEARVCSLTDAGTYRAMTSHDATTSVQIEGVSVDDTWLFEAE